MTAARPAGDGGPAGVAVAAAVLGPRARLEMPLGPLTTYRVGGPAAIGVVARSVADLVAVGAAASASGLDVLVVGRGSNLLVADAGFRGIAVLLDPDAFGVLEIDGGTVRAGAALPLPALARRSVEAGLTGMEWAVGVPGSVGGGVRMNAGGHGSEIAESLVVCRVVDLSAGSVAVATDLGPTELDHGYRRSSLRSDQVVTAAVFGLGAGDRESGRATIREIVRWRREHQPGGQNAGSVFVNPRSSRRVPQTVAARPGGEAQEPSSQSAGSLIDAAGLKGLRVGSAEVSRKHANFIQADAGGSADDVYALMATVKARVLDRWGVTLRSEIRLVGFE